MDRREYIMLFSVALGWALFFGGLDDVPGWQGFGRGLFAGTLPVLAILVIRRYQSWRSQRRPSPSSDRRL
jgi:hypothetical protein